MRLCVRLFYSERGRVKQNTPPRTGKLANSLPSRARRAAARAAAGAGFWIGRETPGFLRVAAFVCGAHWLEREREREDDRHRSGVAVSCDPCDSVT